ncbi:hypothetical protein [Sedimentisphaera salicampi]|uniref:hypothetical protein n=1 Tax=Sedimentisphaera salicampi TaxID=1941349 RepID=UPI001056DA85|nr:hypothetical protein [Sedimentisphaera salicampi]
MEKKSIMDMDGEEFVELWNCYHWGNVWESVKTLVSDGFMAVAILSLYAFAAFILCLIDEQENPIPEYARLPFGNRKITITFGISAVVLMILSKLISPQFILIQFSDLLYVITVFFAVVAVVYFIVGFSMLIYDKQKKTSKMVFIIAIIFGIIALILMKFPKFFPSLFPSEEILKRFES